MKTSIPQTGANAPVAPVVNAKKAKKIRQTVLDVLDALPVNRKHIQLANPNGGACLKIFRQGDFLCINHGKDQIARLRCNQASLQKDKELRNQLQKRIEDLAAKDPELAQIFMDYQR